MTRARAFMAAGVIVIAGGAGGALTPAVDAQQAVRIQTREGSPRVARVITARGGGRLGVTVSDVDQDAAQAAKLPAPSGVKIDDVSADSPAQAAGLQAGDIVVEYDGERVRSARQFARLVQETPAGRKVPATIVRNGARQTVTLEPREAAAFTFGGDISSLGNLGDLVGDAFSFAMPPPPPAPPAPGAPPAPPVPPFDSGRVFEFGGWLGTERLGVRVISLDPQLAEFFGAREGVLVTSVDTDSPAAKAGVKAGDVIVSVNTERVSSPSDLRRETQRLTADQAFTLEIVRDRKTTTVEGKAAGSARRRAGSVV